MNDQEQHAIAALDRSGKPNHGTAATEAEEPTPPAERDGMPKVEDGLVEQSRDLACLYCIAGQLDQCGGSVDKLLQGIVQTVREAWQCPESTCARVVFNDREYRTPNFGTSRWRHTADISVEGKTVGLIEVCSLEPDPDLVQRVVSTQDALLIGAVARCTGRAIGHLQARRHLEVEREALRNMNIAMREILARTQEGKAEIKKAIQANVDKVILPILDALESGLSGERRKYVELLRCNLEEITSPLTNELSRAVANLTPIEIQTCDMIRRGLSTKEIAQLRHVSQATVSRHREHIRRKLGLTNRTVNLTSYLLTRMSGSAQEPIFS